MLNQIHEQQEFFKQDWLHELYQLLRVKYGWDKASADDYVNCDDWETYYENGYTPEEALAEDSTYWD